MKDQGFKLYYNDFDRFGTAGVSQSLKATSLEAAADEARLFLLSRIRYLPKQTVVHIVHTTALDVSDMNLGKEKA